MEVGDKGGASLGDAVEEGVQLLVEGVGLWISVKAWRGELSAKISAKEDHRVWWAHDVGGAVPGTGGAGVTGGE